MPFAGVSQIPAVSTSYRHIIITETDGGSLKLREYAGAQAAVSQAQSGVGLAAP